MLVSISVTCKDKKEARKIAKALLRKKLVACANMWPVESIYWWQKKMVNDKEILVVFKSLSKNISQIKKEIIKLHSYQTPCLSIEKVDTNQESLKWAKEVIK